MWNDSGPATPPGLTNGLTNGLAKCCQREPMLRVRPKIVFTTEIAYIEFVCQICGHKGGLAITEAEARALWEND